MVELVLDQSIGACRGLVLFCQDPNRFLARHRNKTKLKENTHNRPRYYVEDMCC